MDKYRNVNVNIPAAGGTFIASFCTLRAAQAYVREAAPASYTITINGHTMERCR